MTIMPQTRYMVRVADGFRCVRTDACARMPGFVECDAKGQPVNQAFFQPSAEEAEYVPNPMAPELTFVQPNPNAMSEAPEMPVTTPEEVPQTDYGFEHLETKAELVAYAEEKFGYSMSMRTKETDMRTKLIELHEGVQG